MRSVQPSADLPANNSQSMLGYNSLPSRPQRTTARNMTGIYLGSESSRSNTRARHSIPPLAKPRGVSVGTAADRRRQPLHNSLDSTTAHHTHPRHSVQGTSASNNIFDPDYISNTLLYVYHHQSTPAPIPLPYTPPMILRLPILRPKQQQRVEALRLKDEPRGFNPLPLKKPTKPKTSRNPEDRINNSIGKHALDYSGITRKTGRNFVPVANSGVKRLEDLRSEAGSIIVGTGSIRNGSDIPHHPSPVHNSNVNNKKNLIGLEDCYKRICKGNLSNLQHVMHKKQGGTSKSKAKLITTPLTIRSFRNPQNPHPVVQYTDPKLRHRTAVSPTVNRPPVPAPYYYNSKSLPRTADDGSNRVRLTREHETSFHNHERVLAAPGAGVISASAFRKRNSLPNESTNGFEGRPPSGISGSRPPCLGSNTKIFDSDEMFALRDGFKVPSGTPAASNTDLTRMENNDDAMQYSEIHHNTVSILKQSSQTDVPPPSPATLHRMRIMANKNNSGSDYDSELDTRDGIESTVSLPTIGTRPDTRAELKIADSGIEEQDEDDGGDKMKVSIVISVEDEMGRHVDVNIEEEAGKMDVDNTALPDVNPAESDQSVSNDIANAAQEASIQKQSELQQLIQEHNELVHHIEELEKLKTTFSDDDLSDDEEAT